MTQRFLLVFNRLKISFVFIITAAILLSSTKSDAYPHNGDEFSLLQPDGSRVDVLVWGDEYYQDIESPDGYTLIRDSLSGWICYATLSADQSRYISTGVAYSPSAKGLAKSAAPAALTRHARIKPDAIRQIRARNQQILPPIVTSLDEARSGLGKARAAQAEWVDTIIGLTLLVDFQDVKSSISSAEINNFCNQAGYSGYSNAGSIQDFFWDISNNHLRYINRVTQFITLPKYKSYYDTPNGYGPVAELITDTISRLDQSGFDFSKLTLSSGKVVALNIFYAGSPDHGWANGLWPHSSSYGGNFSADGVKFGSYQITNIGTALSIGTFIHENGHMVCKWPDLYAYDGHSSGVGSFCMMCSQNSKRPQQPNPYFRSLRNWIDIHDISNDPFGNLYEHVANSGSVYQYTGVNHGSSRELFMIEARLKTGRSVSLPDQGMIIWHINKDGRNTDVNYKDLVAVEQADGLFELENKGSADADDCFEAGYRNRFNDNTSPTARWHNGAASGIDIANISAAGTVMTFSLGPDVRRSITVRTPNGGEKLEQRDAITIEWTDNISENVRIELLQGSAVNQVIASSVASSGSHQWTIPGDNATGTDFKVRITSVNDGAITDASDATFTINAFSPTLTVVGGSGSGDYAAGTTVTISADTPPAGMVFFKWTAPSLNLADPRAASTTLIMPDANVTVTAQFVPLPHSLPGRIQAESFSDMSGIQTEQCTDIDGGENVGYLDNGDWIDYFVQVMVPGTYQLDWRHAGVDGGQIELVDQETGRVLQNVTFTGTTGWQDWKTAASTLTLDAGVILLRINVIRAGFNINWLDFITTKRALTVENGSGGGYYEPGTQVTIQADEPIEGMVFDRWTGNTDAIVHTDSAQATFAMPQSNMAVKATFKAAPPDGILLRDSAHLVVRVKDTLLYDNGGKYNGYSNHFRGSITLLPDKPGEYIQITFTDFAIEDTSDGQLWDTVVIYNGSDTTAPVIGRWYGKNTPGVISASNPDGSLTLLFDSDEWLTDDGFRAHIISISQSSSSLPRALQVPSSWGLQVTNGRISYQIPDRCDVVIQVYNLNGALVRTLVDRRDVQPGYFTLSEPLHPAGRTASATYIYRMQAGAFTTAIKATRLR